MSTNRVYVTIVRPGKESKTVDIARGGTVRDALLAAGLNESEFANWSVQDEDGDALTLNSRLENSTSLIVGMRVDGAA